MEAPGLKLVIVQGPRAGETLDFKAGSTIRVGRIVRGNNLTIKDNGISSKHLIIASESSAKWTIQDLDTSNGTTLNSNRLPPNAPVELQDNDTVKIGEYTSISVKLVTEVLDESVKPRRNPRRQAAARVTRSSRKNEVAVENSECEVIEIESNIGRKGRGRGKGKRGVPPETESSEVEIEAKENLKAEQMPAKSNEVQILNLKSEQQMETDCNEFEITKSGNVKQGSGEKVEDKGGDLERMTLGDWFDYLEGYLQKQIIEATEEMIERMRTHADRVHQYMKDQKKTKNG